MKKLSSARNRAEQRALARARAQERQRWYDSERLAMLAAARMAGVHASWLREYQGLDAKRQYITRWRIADWTELFDQYPGRINEPQREFSWLSGECVKWAQWWLKLNAGSLPVGLHSSKPS